VADPIAQHVSAMRQRIRQAQGGRTVDIRTRSGRLIRGVPAAIGTTHRTAHATDGVETRLRVRDYLIPASALTVDGRPYRLERGDEIKDDGATWEVASPGGTEPEAVESDSEGRELRVHTQLIDRGD